MSCSQKVKNNELLEWIAWGRQKLSGAGIEEAQEECERILMFLLGCSRSGIYLKEHELSGVRERFLKLLEKRLERIPLAYLLNKTDFWLESLYVDERCLIPRPETEVLVERVIETLRKSGKKEFSFLDIGTGSGAIAIAILRAFANAKGTMLDLSEEALEVAQENLKRYSLEDRAQKVRGDLFKPFSGAEKWDLIVSNPPYLSQKDWEGVQEELKFEPRMALEGGKDGLDFYRNIIRGARQHLNPGGLIALEVGKGQTEQVSTWLQEAGYDNIQRFNDYLQVQRVVMAQGNFD